MTDAFLPDEYEIPKGPTSYTRFDPGDHKLRILSAPLMGWVYWKDKKPIRSQMNARPEPAPKDLKHFWAVIVWNYQTMQVEIAEITQKAVQSTLKDLNKNPDWGAPYAYDITIKRVGTTMNDTEYSLLPSPAKPLAQEIIDGFKAKPIQLDLLLTGDDPFQPKGTPTPMQEAPAA